MRFFDGEDAAAAATPAPEGAATAAPGGDAAAVTTGAPAGGGGEGPVPPHDPANDFPEKQTETNTTTPGFAPLAFDQSYAWMLQLVVLVAAMTMLFPFLRNLIGIKPKKRQVINYSSFDSGEEDDDDEDEDCEENCEKDLKEYSEED